MKKVLYFGLQGLASDEKMASTSNSNCNSQSSSENSSSSNVHQFIGQRLYKHDGKLSKRAQEVTGIPLINYNLQPLVVNNKEPLKRTFSASGASVTTGKPPKASETSSKNPMQFYRKNKTNSNAHQRTLTVNYNCYKSMLKSFDRKLS